VGGVVRIIALLPVRNEAWVLRHSLACLTAFCDVVLVSDQGSTDRSRDICREFSGVQVIDSPPSLIAEQARFRLWDVAREYDGQNLIWCTDADELVSPTAAGALFADRDRWRRGTVLDCWYVHLWESTRQYVAEGPYTPYWKPVAVVDDRRMDFVRDGALPIHRERVPMGNGPRVHVDGLTVMHLQWLLPRRNQMRQAWYRCREWMAGTRSVQAINAHYTSTLHPASLTTAEVPPAWTDGVTFPEFQIDDQPAWQELEILSWFDERGIAAFEPLDIWFVPRLREEFIRRTGRLPHPDRSHIPRWHTRAAARTRRLASAVRRRLLP
jgi:hypothetical protein